MAVTTMTTIITEDREVATTRTTRTPGGGMIWAEGVETEGVMIRTRIEAYRKNGERGRAWRAST